MIQLLNWLAVVDQYGRTFTHHCTRSIKHEIPKVGDRNIIFWGTHSWLNFGFTQWPVEKSPPIEVQSSAGPYETGCPAVSNKHSDASLSLRTIFLWCPSGHLSKGGTILWGEVLHFLFEQREQLVVQTDGRSHMADAWNWATAGIEAFTLEAFGGLFKEIPSKDLCLSCFV